MMLFLDNTNLGEIALAVRLCFAKFYSFLLTRLADFRQRRVPAGVRKPPSPVLISPCSFHSVCDNNRFRNFSHQPSAFFGSTNLLKINNSLAL
jgi:hypothetical protein